MASSTHAARVRDQFEQPLQREDGGVPAVLWEVLPVGLLVARLPGVAAVAGLPGPEVEGGQVGELQRGDRAASVRRPVHAAVVDADEMAVGGQPYIAFEGVRTVLDRLLVGGQGVLGGLFGGSAMGDDLDPVLPCEGHRVMVPPRRGRRGTEGP